MTEMTEARKLVILALIQEFGREHGYPPSMREIAAVLGLASPSSAFYALEHLRDQGLVSWEPGKTRTLTLTRSGIELLP